MGGETGDYTGRDSRNEAFNGPTEVMTSDSRLTCATGSRKEESRSSWSEGTCNVFFFKDIAKRVEGRRQ